MGEPANPQIILTDVYFAKGLPVEGWVVAGLAPRMLKALEIGNRNIPKRFKEPLFSEPANPTEREERLATLWMAYITDSGFSINSSWSASLDISEIWCPLPTSFDEFRRKVSGKRVSAYSLDRPTTWLKTRRVVDPKIYTKRRWNEGFCRLIDSHPVADTFVLVVKGEG